MDRAYADTVRLLLAIAPEVFANDIFAMKGGTATRRSSGWNVPSPAGWLCAVARQRRLARHGG